MRLPTPRAHFKRGVVWKANLGIDEVHDFWSTGAKVYANRKERRNGLRLIKPRKSTRDRTLFNQVPSWVLPNITNVLHSPPKTHPDSPHLIGSRVISSLLEHFWQQKKSPLWHSMTGNEWYNSNNMYLQVLKLWAIWINYTLNFGLLFLIFSKKRFLDCVCEGFKWIGYGKDTGSSG
jgi:hypothetical protein